MLKQPEHSGTLSMTHEFIRTEDGSTTLYVPELNEHYHSVHGAVQESMHIFVRAGIEYYRENIQNSPDPLRILEAGFGTGLNAYLTLAYTATQELPVVYHSLEKYPLTPEEAARLNYTEQIPYPRPEHFARLHEAPWETLTAITPDFSLCKHRQDLRDTCFPAEYDIVFFDAFNPDVQPHLWTEEVFRRFFDALKPGGILVTYCVKGIVKQALRQVGFSLKRLPGPPGKREILRATKPAGQENEKC